jgi:hypothetical protein
MKKYGNLIWGVVFIILAGFVGAGAISQWVDGSKAMALIGFMITAGDIVCVFDAFHRYDKNR